MPIRVKTEVFEKAAREQEPGSIHPATRHQAGSDAATDMARTADARKEADTLAALLAKGAIEAVQEQGLLGAFTGGASASAGGVTGAIFFGCIFALLARPKTK